MALMFISFIELILEGGWNDDSVISQSETFRTPLPKVTNARTFWTNAQAYVNVVEPEVVIRRFMLRPTSRVYVGDSVVSFDSAAIEDELSVDESQRAVGGKRLKFVSD